MGDDKLKVIAAELITQVRKSVTIDWTLREGARAKIRVMVKLILNKYGYWLPRCRRSVGLRPVLCTACLSRSGSFGSPDLQEEAVKTVLQQAELLCAEWG